VFTISKTTNQTLLPPLAAFQSAIPFQTNDHIAAIIINNTVAPAKPGGIDPPTKLCKPIIFDLAKSCRTTRPLECDANN